MNAIRPASRLARGVALCVFLGAGLVICGYALHFHRLIVLQDGLQGMSPLTALAAMLLAASIYVRDRRRATQILAGIGIALGSLVLFSFASTGGDAVSSFIAQRVFYIDPIRSGSTSIATALSIIVLGVAIVARERPKISDAFAAFALVLAGFALLGYAYGVRDLYDISIFRTMALHTALAMFALGVAVLAMNPTMGWAAVVTAPTATGLATRRLLAFTLLPPVAGFILLRATDAHRMGPGAAMAFFVVITVVPLALLIVKNGAAAAALDLERKAIVDVQRAGDLELRHITDALPAPASLVYRRRV